MKPKSVELCELPEECISHILSFTSPIDVFRSMTVSKSFLSASDSDVVWGNFLPSDYPQIISRSSTPIEYHSKKDLFLLLSQSHILIDDNTMSFALDKRTGKKCYMIGAKALTIAWGGTPEYWTWESMDDSRFPIVAELQSVRVDNNVGFDDIPVKVSMVVYDEDSEPNNNLHNIGVKSAYLVPLESAGRGERIRRRRRPEIGGPSVRGDGWMEIEIGKYQGDNNDRNESSILKMSVSETEILHWKRGIVVQGIELRPLR